ncbi:hypothetical protein F383_13502 [Gossypium arboreum]|uniref:Uncharacterized protein n=1 Tax=Gossypium arboreum TaxID=29729 RepID=A0A0B0N8W6_GOSAR|nr:hypothetical protein F383_13502 [Gossypium arboreum]
MPCVLSVQQGISPIGLDTCHISLSIVCLFLIRLKTCLSSSTNTSCLSVLRSDHVIPLSIS